MTVRRSIALLPALVVGLAVPATPALAQGWSGSTPIFESDIRRTEEEAAAQRAARRASHTPVVYPKFMDGGARPDIAPAEPPIVYLERDEEVGSIIVDTQNRRLLYILPGKRAYLYPISVGRDGFTWTGTERVSRIAAWPSWTPPPEMHKRQPGLPITVSGGLKNPQGARALYLGSTIYRIHGTNNDRTVGRANSSGCFRLTNEHVVHLASIVRVGAKVRVMQAYTGGVSEGPPMASLFSLFGSSEPAKPAATPKAKPKPRPKVVKQSSPVVVSQTKGDPVVTGSTAPVPAAATPAAAPAAVPASVPAPAAATPAQ
jgi:lipoprotein-anchoring transpeptidase ErfK/SrfK